MTLLLLNFIQIVWKFHENNKQTFNKLIKMPKQLPY